MHNKHPQNYYSDEVLANKRFIYHNSQGVMA